MDQPKIERLLRLIMLMTSKVDHTIEDISERLGITCRSVYRYIDTLRKTGFVVEKRRSNLYKLIKMPDSTVNLNKLIYFTEEEAYIINRVISGIDNTNSLKAGLLKKLSAIYSLTSIADLTVDRNIAQNIEDLGNAIIQKKKVYIRRYESAHSDVISDRYIEPFAFTTNYIDIWAYDIDKQENRTFKISRIGSIDTTENDWTYEDSHISGHSDCFRMNGTSRIPIRLEMSLRAKNLIIEEYPLAAKDITNRNGRWFLDTDVCNLAGVGRFVIGLAAEIRIIDSPELEEYVQEYALKYIIKQKARPGGPTLNVFTTE